MKYFLMVFLGGLAISFIPIPEVPTSSVSMEKVYVSETKAEEEGVCISEEVMNQLVELYYHHIQHHQTEQHTHPPELLNPHHPQRGIHSSQNLL